MAQQQTNSDQNASGSFTWAYAVAIVVCLGIIGAGIYLMQNNYGASMLAVGAGGLVAVLVCWPVAATLKGFRDSSCGQAEQALASINERFEQFSIMLNLISEQQLLSDRAKAVAFREKDSDALRRAIQDEMFKKNWEVALSLANEMEAAFGYKQEADRLRYEIEERHQEVISKQVAEAQAVIDRHVRGEMWDEAIKEAKKTAKLFPYNVRAIALPDDVATRKETHKKQLIESWNDAVGRHDVDGAIEILKRLDNYLTPTEGEAFQETARSVFKEKIGILRTQFSVAVQDHKWAEAVRLGEQITTDFPNSQMAKEVRDMMDTLKSRASGLEPAQV